MELDPFTVMVMSVIFIVIVLTVDYYGYKKKKASVFFKDQEVYEAKYVYSSINGSKGKDETIKELKEEIRQLTKTNEGLLKCIEEFNKVIIDINNSLNPNTYDTPIEINVDEYSLNYGIFYYYHYDNTNSYKIMMKGVDIVEAINKLHEHNKLNSVLSNKARVSKESFEKLVEDLIFRYRSDNNLRFSSIVLEVHDTRLVNLPISSVSGSRRSEYKVDRNVKIKEIKM